nr:E3 ubiquitin-protein ligase RING1-like [Aegilops tauschii subsp. strangulata]
MNGSDHDNEAFPMAADEQPHQDSAVLSPSHGPLLANLFLMTQIAVYEDNVTDDDERGGGFGAVPASEKEIAGFAQAAVGDTREEECVVCLESFKEGDDIRKLPCSHGFHNSCISDWLRVSCLCPQCRFALPADDEWSKPKTEFEHSATDYDGYENDAGPAATDDDDDDNHDDDDHDNETRVYLIINVGRSI